MEFVGTKLYERALVSPSNAATCAKVYAQLMHALEPTVASMLKKVVLKKCQQEFERELHPSGLSTKARRTQIFLTKITQVQNIQFIAHLYLQSQLAESIVLYIVAKLLHPPKPYYLNQLCHLLQICGCKLDTKANATIVDAHFTIITECSTNSRYYLPLRRTIHDLLLLRSRKWIQYDTEAQLFGCKLQRCRNFDIGFVFSK